MCCLCLLPAVITPAWAGKSRLDYYFPQFAKDHPRVGGEKWLYLDDFFCLAGSPPHGRGKGRRIVPNVEGLRITPA